MKEEDKEEFKIQFPMRFFPMCESAILTEENSFNLNLWTTVTIALDNGGTIERLYTQKYKLHSRDADFSLLCRNSFMQFAIKKAKSEEGFKNIIIE